MEVVSLVCLDEALLRLVSQIKRPDLLQFSQLVVLEHLMNTGAVDPHRLLAAVVKYLIEHRVYLHGN